MTPIITGPRNGEQARYSLLADCTTHPLCALRPEIGTGQAVIQIFLVQVGAGPKDNELARPESNAVRQSRGDSELSVLEAWGDFCQKYVAIGKVCIAANYG